MLLAASPPQRGGEASPQASGPPAPRGEIGARGGLPGDARPVARAAGRRFPLRLTCRVPTSIVDRSSAQIISGHAYMTSSDTNTLCKERPQFVSMMNVLCDRILNRENLSLLVLGGSDDDIHSLRQLRFSNVILSNLSVSPDGSECARSVDGRPMLAIDAEDMAVPNSSYDLVFAHEVLHHCRSPHRALCEMLRVARRYVMFMEPNDSLVMRSLVRMGFSFPYELPAVIDHGGRSGGVRDSAVPNFIYRWNRNEVCKAVASFLAEYVVLVHARSYWDFGAIDEEELALRSRTRLSTLTKLITPRGFLATLRFCQRVLNRVPILRNQGNKFLCLVEKKQELKPWLRLSHNEIAFKF
jgi:SAM-dependent methyltransferase